MAQTPHAAALLRAQASTEPWFDIPYVEAPVANELLDAWAAAKGKGGDLALPQRNEFIATDFSLRCEDGGGGAAAHANGAAHAHGGSSNGSAKVHFWVALYFCTQQLGFMGSISRERAAAHSYGAAHAHGGSSNGSAKVHLWFALCVVCSG